MGYGTLLSGIWDSSKWLFLWRSVAWERVNRPLIQIPGDEGNLISLPGFVCRLWRENSKAFSSLLQPAPDHDVPAVPADHSGVRVHPPGVQVGQIQDPHVG